jgi:hypothetical protein
VPGSIGVPVAGSAVFASTGAVRGPPLSTTSVIRRRVSPRPCDRGRLQRGVRDRRAHRRPVERLLVGPNEVRAVDLVGAGVDRGVDHGADLGDAADDHRDGVRRRVADDRLAVVAEAHESET